MADTLTHRGPDDAGTHVAPHIGLGFRRLSIIDLAGGHQPLSNEDGSVWIVFNGEIYNYLELRERLEGRHRFRTRSDTEVIVQLYEEVGEECFSELRGMFSIAIWDGRKQRLVLARDRVGKKPLFYFSDQERFVFGSEMKAILAHPGIPRELDLESISDYFSFLYIPAPKSIFRHVRKVRPGHFLVVSREGMREQQYWDLRFEADEEISEQEWCNRLMEKYEEAVRIRLMSDVPLGAFLSGGIDSSSIVKLMAKITRQPVQTCTIGFAEEEFNEAEMARVFAASLGADHHEKIVRPQAFEIVERLAWLYDEPFADASAVPTFYVSQVARERVTVVLSGDGGDENFCGYRRYTFQHLENHIRRLLPARLRAPLFGALGRVYPKMDWAPRFLRAKSTFESVARTPIEGYFHSTSALRPALKAAMLSGDLKQALAGYDSLAILQQYYDRQPWADPVSRIQYVDIKTYLTDDILVKVDRASMGNSLEVRCPILDHELMELVARIPARLKLRGLTSKYIFKRALRNFLPPEVLRRKKQGFGVPVGAWLRRDLREIAESILFVEDDGLLDQQCLRRIWNQHQSGLRNYSTPLWTVLMFRMWQRKFACLSNADHSGAAGENTHTPAVSAGMSS